MHLANFTQYKIYRGNYGYNEGRGNYGYNEGKH